MARANMSTVCEYKARSRNQALAAGRATSTGEVSGSLSNEGPAVPAAQDPQRLFREADELPCARDPQNRAPLGHALPASSLTPHHDHFGETCESESRKPSVAISLAWNVLILRGAAIAAVVTGPEGLWAFKVLFLFFPLS